MRSVALPEYDHSRACEYVTLGMCCVLLIVALSVPCAPDQEDKWDAHPPPPYFFVLCQNVFVTDHSSCTCGGVSNYT